MLALLLIGCGGLPGDAPRWTDQLQPDSPCYRVDLLDGLDESSTDEVQALFDCLDQGQLSSLRHTAQQLEEPTRSGDPAGVDLARAVNALPEVGADPWALAGVLLDALQAEDRPVDELLDLYLELSYGVPANQVRGPDFVLTSSHHLDGGVLVPLSPGLGQGATALLDDSSFVEFAGEVLAERQTKCWVRTLSSWARSTRPEVAQPVAGLVPGLGQLFLDVRSPGNDRWSGASGDSLRDLIEVMSLQSSPVIEHISPEAEAILQDPVARRSLELDLVDWQDQGVLQDVPSRMVWLASVDIEGGSLQSGELSAFVRLVRLLHGTNRRMQCSLDLWVTTIDVDLGNLAVSLLGYMADQDPDTVQTGVGILGEVIGWGLSEWVLEGIADSGTCPVLTNEVVSDLPALDLLYLDENYPLLVVAVGALSDLKYAQEDHIPDLVDMVADLHEHDATQPVEELLRDAGECELVYDAIDLLPVLADPQDYGITAGDEAAADFQDLVDVLAWVFTQEPEGTGFERARPLVAALADEPSTWEALGTWAGLALDPSSQTSQLLPLIPRLLDLDPELTTLDSLGAVLAAPSVARPALQLAETQPLRDALLASQPQASDPEVPLAFGARLIVGGTLEELLTIVDLVVDTLQDLVE